MKNRRESSFRQFFHIVLSACIFSAGLFPVAAQTKRAAKPVLTKQPTTGSKQNCNGGWSGVVTFSKTRNYQQDTGKVKQIPHGTNHKIYSQDYKYAGRIAVDGSQNPRAVTAKAQVNLTDVRKKWSRDDQMDTCFYDGKEGSVPQWTEKRESDITNAFGEGEAQFWMNVNELSGTYSFNFRFPEAQGTNDRTYDKTAGGWCNPEFNKPESSAKKYPEKVDGEGAEIGDQKINPKTPDVLSGSKTWTDGNTESTKTVYTVTWSFRRCPAPLELEAVEFDEYRYPKWGEWQKVDGETVDGNRVRVRARVTNYSSETKFPQLKFIETKANVELPDSQTSISIAPGESREVEYLWDTSGWAWETGGIPASDREVKVEMTEPTVPTKNLSADVLIIPRPVILAHGLWADYTAWDGYDRFFKQAHSTSWNSYAVGANPSDGVMNTGEKGTWKPSNSIGQNADGLKKQIEAVRRNKNAWQVDIVAHSMGGLIARYYIAEMMDILPTGVPVVSRLVQLGTPNEGSPCAYLADFTFWMLGKQTRAVQDLLPVRLEKFNRSIRNRRGTRFSVLVGNSVPQTCQSNIWGDGVVEIPSARWEIKDYRYTRSIHTDLTSQENFEYFVWRRLAVSWRGNHKPDTDYQANYENRNSNPAQFLNASFEREDDKPTLPENLKVELTKEVNLQPKQTTEIEIPVAANSNAGITFFAAPNVSASLINETGAIVAKSAANSPEAKTDFRGFPIQSKSNGVWKLKLENTGAGATSVIVAAWSDSSAQPLRLTLEVSKPNAGQITLTAKLTDRDLPVIGASIKARLKSDDGKTFDLVLLENGQNGIYGAVSEKLPNGDYTVEAIASHSNQNAFAAVLTVGAVQKQNATTKKK
jgi:pimeloyl-ACP methyl ester carboxylesterase